MYPWRPARVGIPGVLGPYDAEVHASEQNTDGSPVPRFDLRTVEQIARDCTASGDRWPYRLQLVDDIAEVLPQQSDAAPLADPYEADEDGRYWIGAYRWPWEERPYYGPTARLMTAVKTLAVKACGCIASDPSRAEAYGVLSDWLQDLHERMTDRELPYIPPLEMRIAHALAEVHDT